MTELRHNYKAIGHVNEDSYNETTSAQATSRVLDGSSDAGYYCEYVGYGTVEYNGQTIEVSAVYLFDASDLIDTNGEQIDDEGAFPWDTALKRFEIND